MLKITDYTQKEIDHILFMANFTEREKILFNLRGKEFTLEECAEKMNCSKSTIDRLNKKIKHKIKRVFEIMPLD